MNTQRHDRTIPCVLALLLAASAAPGCVPGVTPATLPPGERPATIAPAAGDHDLLRCSTAAFDGGEMHPLALRLEADLAAASPATLWTTLLLAHRYGADDPFPFAPQEGDEPATVTLDGGALRVEADSFTLDATLLGNHAALWTGALDHELHGELAVSCWRDDFAGAFRYAPSTGDCLDADGVPGRNEIPVPFLRDAGDGHCADLSGLMLNEDDLGYPDLGALDLRGALLDGAMLSFANIHGADWGGADLSTFEFGYALLSGARDAHTLLRADACADADPGVVDCMR